MSIFRTLIRQKQQVSGSFTYDDTLTMANAETYISKNLESDFNYIRTQLKVITGEANWFDAPVQSLTDFDAGISGSLANIYSFTGMSGRDDSSPTYSSTIVVTQNGSLETAIGELDAAIATVNIDKAVERLLADVSSGSAHTIPDSLSYTPAGDGENMEVYFNGQLLQASTGAEERDYEETSTTTIKFTFTVPANSYLTFLIRQ